MQASYQQCWGFALSGARQYPPEIITKPGVLRRTLRRVGGQIIVFAFVLCDIGGLAFTLVAPVWLAPWLAINVAALVVGSLSWSEDRRIQWESSTAMQRQGEKVRAAVWRNLQEQQRKAQREQREAERRQRLEKDEREAQKRLHDALRQAEEQLREAEQRRYQKEKEREAQRQQQNEQAERLRQAKQEQREAEQRWRQAEQQRKAQRKQRREYKRVVTQFQADWWIVLGVAPSASKDEIVRKYRHKIKECHPDRFVGLAPELLQLAEEQTKALNEAYETAMRARRYAQPTDAAA